MHAFLIVGNTNDPLAAAHLHKDKVVEFPFAKIDDVRALSGFTKLKLTDETVIILKNFDKAGDEAQSAFLKALEEPQENLIYLLTATNLDGVLPTIISRCETIEIPNIKFQISNNIKTYILKFINGDIGERLSVISKINKREEAINFVQNLILVSHEVMLKDPNSKFQILNQALETLRVLEANGNIQLQLTNFIVSLATL